MEGSQDAIRRTQALHEAGIEPDCVIGTSIGAINGAIVAGNQVSERVEKLHEFWGWLDTRVEILGRKPSLNFPHRWLGWIGQFELDRGLTENADDRGLFATRLHTVIMRRVRYAPHETASRDRHCRLGLKGFARIHPTRCQR